MSNKSKRQPKLMPVIKLDLGAGKNPQPGFTSVDLYAPGVDIKCDLFCPPFRRAVVDQTRVRRNEFGIEEPVILLKDGILWKDNTVDEIHASHFIEHIPQQIRWPFFVECWRIMKPDATMRIFVPNWKSERAYGDQTHCWPPVVAMFFFYLNKGWREANKLTYGPYDIKCNFDHNAGATAMNPEFSQRSHEVQIFAATHYTESYGDMWVTLTKKPL